MEDAVRAEQGFWSGGGRGESYDFTGFTTGTAGLGWRGCAGRGCTECWRRR